MQPLVSPVTQTVPAAIGEAAGGGGGGFPTPMFAASLKSSLVPETATGSSTPTFTRATAATVTDFEGLVKPVISGESRFAGARRVRNLLAGPTNTLATEVVTVVSGSSYRVSFSGTGTITLSGASTLSLAGTSGQRSAIATFAASSTSLTVTVSGSVTSAMVEDVTGQANQNPSEYVSNGVLSAPFHGANVDGVKYFTTKNGNTVAANIVTEATGAAIGASDYRADADGPFGYVSELARTNSWRFSQAFTDATWVKTNCTVTTPSVASPSGAPTVDAVNVAVGADALVAVSQNITVVTAQTWVSSFYVKAGAWNFIQLAAGTKFGTTDYVNFNLSTGAVASTNMVAGKYGIQAFPNGWYRVWSVNATNGAGTSSVFPCFMATDIASRAPTVPRPSAVTVAYIWGAQAELGTNSAHTSYIPTTGAAVSRNADTLLYAGAGNIASAAGTLKYTTSYTSSTQAGISGPVLMISGTFALLGLSTLADHFQAFTPDFITAISPAGVSAYDSPQWGITTWGAEFKVAREGVGYGTPVAYSSFVVGDFYVGYSNTTASWVNGTVRNIEIYDTENVA